MTCSRQLRTDDELFLRESRVFSTDIEILSKIVIALTFVQSIFGVYDICVLLGTIQL